MDKFIVSEKVFRVLAGVGLLLCLVGIFRPARLSAAEFTARTIADSGGISVMEVEGDYSSTNSDGNTYTYPREVVAKEFYKTHTDRYDFLVFFSDFDFPMPKDAVAFYNRVKNDIKGIGLGDIDNSTYFGSSSVLQGTIDMGNLSNIAADPLDPGFSFTMGTLSHELMHRWGAYVHFKPAGIGGTSSDLLGQLDSHWSFLLDTKGSLEYGNNWRDNGNGTFTSFPGRKYFSPLDLYLMGLIDKSAVSPMLLIANPDVDPKQVSQSGVTIGGLPRYVTIGDITNAEGERIPNFHDSQKSFRVGCVFLTRPGTYNPDNLSSIRTVLNHWPIWFSSLTNGLAQVTIDAALEEKPATNPGPGTVTVDPRTIPPAITDGVTWLVAQQRTDGSWQDDPATSSRDTAEALRVLKNFPDLFPDSTAGADFLLAAQDGNNDFVSRKALTLATLGYPATDLLALLNGSTNQDGAWGGVTGEESNTLDSGLIVRALVESGLAEGSSIAEVVAYLNDRQNPDGGWGRAGQDSDLLTTTNVMVAFNALSGQGFGLSAQLDQAGTWLQNRQNLDGGFGGDGSSVDQTALAFGALKKAGISGAIGDKALDYIANAQGADGSWNGSVYDTALAVTALWTAEKEPDLEVTSAGIRITPDTITLLPTQIEIVADIANKGLPNLPAVKVAIYDGAETPENLLAERVISVNGKSSAQAHFALPVANGNTHRYLVVVDPENLIAESSEANNRAMKWLYPEDTYDLVIKPGDIQATPAEVAYYQPVTIAVKVANRGTLDAFKVPLRFYLDDGVGQYAITARYVDVPAGGTTADEFVWLADHPGVNQRLTVMADPFGALMELDKTNNQASCLLTVQQSTKANLKISRQDLTVNPSPALEAADAVISAIVTNNGFAAVQNVVVEFRSARPDNSDKSLLGLEIIPELAAGATTTVAHLWKNVTITGDKIISVLLDPDNQVEEITKDDNQTFTELNILTLPDLAVSGNSITLSPAYPKEGEALIIQVAVQNNGGQAVKDVAVALALDGGTPQTLRIPAIAGNSAGSITFNLTAAVVVNGVHTLQVVVDPENLIQEKTKGNNRAEKEFGVQNGEMWLTERYISPNGDGVKDSTAFFFRLKKQQTVQVAISNGDGVVVRKYADPAFSETLSGSIVWDGLSDQGTVVPDGEYRIGAITAGGAPLGSLVVTVDTNRLSFVEAVGTEFLLQNNISCMLPNFEQGQWFKDESGLIISITQPNSNTPDYPTGLYKVSPDGEDVTRLVPASWTSGVDPLVNYDIKGFAIAPDDETIALVMDKSTYNTTTRIWSYSASELWTVDRYGEGPARLAGNDYSGNGELLHFSDPQWSPDGRYLACRVSDYGNSSNNWILLVNLIGGEANRVPVNRVSAFGFTNNWSPDGSRFAYGEYPDDKLVLKVMSASGGTVLDYPTDISGDVNISWLGNDWLIATGVQSVANQSWLFDVSGNTTPIKLSDFQAGPLVVNQATTQNFAFVDSDAKETLWNLKFCDDEAQCQSLHQTYYGNVCKCVKITDLQWSPDGEKLAFISKQEEYPEDEEDSSGWRGQFVASLVVVEATHPSEQKTFPLPEISFSNQVYLRWADDNRSLLGVFGNSILAIDANKGVVGSIPVSDTLIPYEPLSVSPSAKYLTYKAYVPWESICVGSQDLWAASSLLNLTADLRAIKKKDYIELKGIASDRNLSSYELEFAEVGHPNDWHTISPPSANMAINKVLGQWVPPGKGRYYVRLTATDKAGNTIQNRIRLSWGLVTTITGLYQSTDLFSPNGDGIKDTVEIHYRIMAPVHLKFTVLDKDQNLVKTIRREYPEPPGATGEDFITWDGRDSVGRVAPDGLYTIRALDFDFPVEVDNTPPLVSLKINQTDCEDRKGNKIPCYKPFAEIKGKVDDLNILGGIIEIGEGDNPSEWHEVTSEYTGLTYWGEEVAQLGNKKFRLTAFDEAGNKASVTSAMVEELLLFQGWHSKDEDGNLLADWRTGFAFLYKNGQFELKYDDEDGKTKDVSELIPPPDSLPGRSEIRVVETFGLPLISGYVQEQQDRVWRDSQEFAITDDGEFVVPWNNTGAELIRLKVVDAMGGVQFSNFLRLPKPIGVSFGPYCDLNDDGVVEYGVAAGLTSTVGVQKIVFSYSVEGQDDWHDYREDYLSGPIVASGYGDDPEEPYYDDSVAPWLELTGEYYTIKMSVYDWRGDLIRTAYGRYPELCGWTGIGVSYEQATTCNTVAPGRATLAHAIKMPDFVTVKQAQYLMGEHISPDDYVNHNFPKEQVFSLFAPTVSSLPVDTSVMPEGANPVRSEVTFAYGQDVFVRDGDGLLIVDRRIPEITLNKPAAGQKICPVAITNKDGNTSSFVDVHGRGTDFFNNAVTFKPSFALATNPDVWQLAQVNSLDGLAPGYGGPWNVDNIAYPYLSFKLAGQDWVGNLGCTVNSFELDTMVDFHDAHSAPEYFSPNDDGVLDEVAFDFTADEDVEADLLIIVDPPGGIDFNKLSIVRNLLRQEPTSAGVASGASWDGKNNDGVVADDGKYAAYLILTDSCGNQRKGVIGHFTLDNTPPVARIDYPSDGAQVGGVVELSGTADDVNFVEYKLSLEPIAKNVFQNVLPHPIKGGVLGTWQAFGLDGLFTITLEVSDRAGNTSTVSIEVQRSLNDNLIKQFSVTPSLFSPNGDGKKEPALISYELNPEIAVPLHTTITAIDETQQTVWSFSSSFVATGSLKTVSWNGRDSLGQLAPDGKYVVALKAYYPDSPEIFQIEHLTLELDATPPEIVIKFPTPNSYLPNNPLDIVGSVDDAHFAGYQVTLVGEAETQLVDEGTEPRADYKFAALHDLVDGSYTLKVEASDLGEIVASKSVSFVVDRTPPKVSINTPVNGAVYGGADRNLVEIDGAIAELNFAHWQLTYSLKGSQLLPTIMAEGDSLPPDNGIVTDKLAVGAVSGLADGTYVLSLSAVDKAGLKGEKVVLFDIDHTPPELAISEPVGGAYVTKPLDLLGTANDPHLQEYTLEIAPGDCATAYEWSPIASSGTKAVVAGTLGHWQIMPPDGGYCLKLAGLDQVGNTAATSLNVKVDTHPPGAPILIGQIQGRNAAHLTWSGNNEPDLAGFNLYRGGQKLNTDLLGTNPTEYLDPGLTEGSYSWQVTAVDLAGQESLPSAEVRLVVDLTPPEGRILSPDTNATVTDLVSIKGTAFSKDDFREYRVWIGAGAAPATWQLIRKSPLPVNYGELAKWDTAGLSEGLFGIKLEAEDLAGNINTHQITVTVDNQPPKAPRLTGAAARGTLSADVDIVWDANGESDLVGYLVYRNDVLANAPGQVTGNLKPYLLAKDATAYLDGGLPDGTFEYYLLAMDLAGNVSEPSNVMKVEIDTHPPHVQIVAPAAGEAFEHSLLIRGETADLDIATVQFQFKPAAATGWKDLGVPLTLPPYLANLDPVANNLGYGDVLIRTVATDKHPNIDPAPQEVAVKYTDLTPPAAPQNLNSLTQGDVVTLTWDANTNSENDLDGYNVFWLNGGGATPRNSVPLKDTTFQHQVIPNGDYLYQITAVDIYGNTSPASNQVTARVYQPLLTQPATPVGVADLAIAGGGAQAGDQVELFKVVGGELVSAGMATADQEGNFGFNVVLSLGDNQFAARAGDAAGNTSKLSGPVSVFFDEPPATPTGLTGTATGFDVKLTWNANNEPDLVGYHLYRDSKVVTQQVQINGGSASGNRDYNPASNALPGNVGDYSCGYYYLYCQWQLNFDDRFQLVDKVEIDWRSDSGPQYFSLKLLTERGWFYQDITSNYVANNNVEFIPPITASVLMLDITNNSHSGGVVLSEVRVFEKVPLLITSTNFTDLNLPDGNHHYQVSAVDALGLESPLSPEITVPVGDVTPPEPPANLAAFAFGPDALLTWDANVDKDGDLAGYNIYRQEAGEWRKLNVNLLATAGFTDPSLANGSYTYRVTALDNHGNESDPSATATALINLGPPPPPENLSVAPVTAGGALVACWQTEIEAVAYNLYRCGVAGGPYDLLANLPPNVTCYQDEGLINGTTYYYVVTALNRMQYESAYSTEASGKPALADAIPGAPPAPIILNPVAGGGEVTLSEAFTTVSGLAEPGSMVGLFRAGVLVGTTQVSGEDAVESFVLGNFPYGYKLSPDGGKVFFGDYDSIQQRQRLAVYDYVTGANVESDAIGPLGYLDGDWWRRSWSPDSQRVAVGLNDDYGQGMVWLSDPANGRWLHLQPGPAGVWLGGWSPAGLRLALGYYDAMGDGRIVVYDPASNSYSAPEVSVGSQCDFSAWSPDGHQISLDCYDDTSGWLVLYAPATGNLSQVVPPEGNCWADDWSPDGRLLSLTCSDDNADWLEVYDPASGIFSKITFADSTEIYDPVWSPDGQRLAFKYWDAMSGAKGAIYDPGNGSTSQIALPDDLQAISYDWSPDSAGLLVGVTDFAGGGYYYLHTPGDGKVTGVLDGTYAINSYTWLPSGKALVLSVYSVLEDRNLLYRYTVGWDSPVELPVTGDPSDYLFSPDGSRLAYRNTNGLHVLDLASNTFVTYDYPVDMFYWSQDGRQIAFTVWNNTGDDIWLLPLDAPEQARMVYRGSQSWTWVNALSLAADGRITTVASNKLIRIAPFGNFSFPDVPLPERENIFTAAATDPVGNIGPLSEPITVNLAAAALPDLEVTADDIFILPLSPTVGEEVQLEVAVRNRGPVMARNLVAEVYLQQADGMLLFLASGAISELGGDQTAYLDLTWNSLGQAGINKIFVILDPDDQIPEGNEGNNQAAREFLVAGAPGLALTATLNHDHFSADEVLNLDVSIANSGPAVPVSLETTIEDSGGYLVATLPLVNKTLAYGAVDNELLAWPVADSYAGECRIRVRLRDATGQVVAEKLLPFTIQADLQLRASLSSDAVHYGPGQEVRLTARIDNLSTNLMLPELEARLTISSITGELYAENQQLSNLLGGGSAEFTTLWPVGLSAPGNYTAGVTFWQLGQPVAGASTSFAVDSLCNLTGELHVESKVVPLGSPVNVGCRLSSSGNVVAGSQPLTVMLFDGYTQAVLGQSDLVAELGTGNDWHDSVSFAAGLLYPGNFRLVFSRREGANSLLLAEETFSVADLTAPEVRLLSPLAGALQYAAPQLTVAVSDNSGGVGLVEYRYDQGSWRPLPLVEPATGRYATILSVSEADEGDHLLACRATDLAGNTSTPVTVTLALRPLVDLTVSVSPAQPGLGAEVNGRLTMVNHGWGKSVTLQSWIEEGSGAVVKSFPEQSLQLLAGETREVANTWNVGTSPAGPYRLQGRLLKNGAVAVEKGADFTIQPAIVLAGSIQPDQANYGIGVPVHLAATLTSSGNFTIPLLTARLVITDATATPVNTSEQEMRDVAAGHGRVLDFAWNTGHLRAGRYTATMTLLVEGRSESSAVGEIVIIAGDDVPPSLTVVAPTSGAIFSGPFELAALAEDSGGVATVEYQLDNGAWLPLPAQSMPGSYGLSWTPMAAESGSHRVLFRAVDTTGNITTSAPVVFTIALCEPFAGLTGTLAYLPQPLCPGREISFSYTVNNGCPKPLGEATVKLAVSDARTGVAAYSQNAIINLAAQANQAGEFRLALPGLTVGNYLAVLRVAAAGQGERELAAVNLAVVAEPVDTATVVDHSHLLVWLNYGCAGGDANGDLSTADKLECRRMGNSFPSGDQGSSPHFDLLRQALDGAGEYYRLVRVRSRFEAELRDPLVTDILIVGDQQTLPDPYLAELREKVNNGAGLVAAGWLPSGDSGVGASTEEALLGVVGAGGYVPAEPLRLLTSTSPVTTAGEMSGTFGFREVAAAEDSNVVGWLVAPAEPPAGTNQDKPEDSAPQNGAATGGDPAIVLHDYGQGQTIYYAFDFGRALTPENLDGLGLLLRNSLAHAHRDKVIAETLTPLGTVPLQWEVASPEEEQVFHLQAILPPGLRLYDYQTGVWQQEGTWNSTLTLAAGSSGVMAFSFLAPDAAKSLVLEVTADSTTGAGGAVSTLWQERFSCNVPSDRDGLVTTARDAIAGLSVTNSESVTVKRISTSLDQVRLRLVHCDRDLERNIQDLLGASAALLELNHPQVPVLRRQLNELLRMEESRWYFHTGDGCNDDDERNKHRPEFSGR